MYMFRKRFSIILKLKNDVNSNITEKLMAYKKGLDGTYLQPTREECFREFVKAISQLTIDPTERQKNRDWNKTAKDRRAWSQNHHNRWTGEADQIVTNSYKYNKKIMPSF